MNRKQQATDRLIRSYIKGDLIFAQGFRHEGKGCAVCQIEQQSTAYAMDRPTAGYKADHYANIMSAFDYPIKRQALKDGLYVNNRLTVEVSRVDSFPGLCAVLDYLEELDPEPLESPVNLLELCNG